MASDVAVGEHGPEESAVDPDFVTAVLSTVDVALSVVWSTLISTTALTLSAVDATLFVASSAADAIFVTAGSPAAGATSCTISSTANSTTA